MVSYIQIVDAKHRSYVKQWGQHLWERSRDIVIHKQIVINEAITAKSYHSRQWSGVKRSNGITPKHPHSDQRRIFWECRTPEQRKRMTRFARARHTPCQDEPQPLKWPLPRQYCQIDAENVEWRIGDRNEAEMQREETYIGTSKHGEAPRCIKKGKYFN